MQEKKKIEVYIDEKHLKGIELLKKKYDQKTYAGLLRFILEQELEYLVSDLIDEKVN